MVRKQQQLAQNVLLEREKVALNPIKRILIDNYKDV